MSANSESGEADSNEQSSAQDDSQRPATLSPARVAELEALFHDALQVTADEREAIVSQASRRDRSLGEELSALLAAHDSGRSLGAAPIVAAARDAARDTDHNGLRLGPWAVGRRIGAGGMGTVHEGVRADDQYRQRVAIKFLRRIADGDAAARRFRTERQILATLQHPRIAALLDGGVTPDGQPYFVMEFIDGAPITTWCDDRQLDIDARLRLFLEVGDAVRVAHRQLVVHRDLKPGNILVTADGAVKLLDFGIARLLSDADGGVDGEVPQTAIGARVFTPEYAAPEQIRGEPVGTAADVYALGVLLFELIAGKRPFALNGLSLTAMERTVEQTPAPRVSSAVNASRVQTMHARSLERLRRAVHGDLDAIVGMALRKEPDRRYQSVDAFMEDVSRHLAGRPVRARPDSLGYRVGKFIRRRRAETLGTSVALASLVLGATAAMQQATRASAEAARATEVQTFLTDMLGAAKPGVLGPEAKVRDVLDSAAVRLERSRSSPALEAELRHIIGGTYVALGEYAAADTQYQRSLTAYARAVPEGNTRSDRALLDLGVVRWEEGRYESADSVLRIVDSLYRIREDVPVTDRATLLDTRAQTLARLGRNAEALPLFYQSLDLHRQHYPDDATAGVPTYVSAAVVESDLANPTAADTLLKAALALEKRAGAPDGSGLPPILAVRAGALERMGQLDSAEAIYREVIGMRERLLGAEHPNLAMSMLNFGDHLRRRGRYLESTQWTRRVIALRGRTLEPTHTALGAAMMHLGVALSRMDSASVGERWVREALAVRTAALPAGHWILSSTRSSLGEVLTQGGKYQEAESLLLPAEKQLSAELPHELEPVQDVWRRLVELYRAWGRPAEAAKWERTIEAARSARASNTGAP
ncbi:MAG: protein kinase [Gemmatimonadaceae bacterium]|nr:protein kinase [Gemmatimonadaceae bacterium]